MSASDLERKLQEVITQGIDEFPHASPVDLVRWMREYHGPLVEAFERKWADDKLVSLFLVEKRRLNPVVKNTLDRKGRPRFGHPKQSRLPFSEQFERIPYYLILEPRTRQSRGREVELPNATLADLKKRRSLIRGEQSVELPQLNRLIGIMEMYDRMQPGIRVKKALELRSTARRDDKQA